MSGCAAPTEGVALDYQLACDPSSGCISVSPQQGLACQEASEPR